MLVNKKPTNGRLIHLRWHPERRTNSPMAKTEWQEKLKRLKDGAGMSLSAISKETGISTGALGDLATGRSKSPRYEAAVRLNNLYGQKATIIEAGLAAKAKGKGE
jgi:transcriptional regulator with XRE-family HTH domain